MKPTDPDDIPPTPPLGTRAVSLPEEKALAFNRAVAEQAEAHKAQLAAQAAAEKKATPPAAAAQPRVAAPAPAVAPTVKPSPPVTALPPTSGIPAAPSAATGPAATSLFFEALTTHARHLLAHPAAPRVKAALVPLWFLLLPLLLFGRALGDNWFLFGTDTYSHDYIMHLYGWDSILNAGRLPLWCPYLFCGTPFIASFALCPFYPSQLFYFLFPHNTAFTLQYVAAVWAAGALFWWWLRRGLHCGPATALWGGTAMALSGHFLTLTYAGHLQKMMALAWVPLALGATRIIIRRRPGAPPPTRVSWRDALPPPHARRGALLLAVAIGMQFLASHTQIAYATIILCAAYTAAAATAQVWDARRRRMAMIASSTTAATPPIHHQTLLRASIRGVLFAAALALGFFFAAMQMFPGMEMSGISNRADGVSFAEAVETSYPPSEVGEYIVPRMRGDSVRGTSVPYYGAWGERIVSDYLGALILGLAIAGLALRRGRLKWFLAGAALAALVVGLGRYTPLYKVLYALMPGFNRFRSPGTFMFVTNFCVITLAALGMDELGRTAFRVDRRRVLVAALGSVAAIALLVAAWASYQNYGVDLAIATRAEFLLHHHYAIIIRAALEIAVAAALILGVFVTSVGSSRRRTARAVLGGLSLILLAAASLHFIRLEPLAGYRAFLENQALYATLKEAPERPLRLLEERGLKTDAILHGVGVPTGYHPIVLGRYERLTAMLGSTSPAFGNLYDITYAHTYTSQPPPGTWDKLGQYGPEAVWKWAGEERLWARSNAKILEVQDPDLIPSLLPKLGAEAYLTEPGALKLADVEAGAQSQAARLESWAPSRIVLRHVGDKRGIIPLAENFAPGWHATDARGNRLPVVPLNVALRGVVVPAGLGTVTLTYDPFSFRLGAFLSYLAVTLLLARALHLAKRRRRAMLIERETPSGDL